MKRSSGAAAAVGADENADGDADRKADADGEMDADAYGKADTDGEADVEGEGEADADEANGGIANVNTANVSMSDNSFFFIYNHSS